MITLTDYNEWTEWRHAMIENKFNFDEIHNRINTNSIKWDYAYENDALIKRNVEGDPFSEGELLPMWIADMDFQTAPAILEAIQQRVDHGIFGYTLPDKSYYDAIIHWMDGRQGWKIDREWILTTPSVLFSISVAIQTFTEPGDKVNVQTPVFKPFYTTIENNQRELSRNPLIYEDGHYFMDFGDLEAKAADPHANMIILCSPHNPVGRVWTQDELYRFGEICQQNDILIVSDEIHSNLIYSWADFVPFGAVGNEFQDRLILVNSPTKTFNTPGIKASNAFIPDPHLRAKFSATLAKLNEHFGASTISSLVLQTAYGEGADWLDQLMAYLNANYQFTQEYFEANLAPLRIVRPEALYLIWVDCRELGFSGDELQRLFYSEARVYIEEGSKYGPEGEGFVRLNIACPRTLLEEALNRMHRALRGL